MWNEPIAFLDPWKKDVLKNTENEKEENEREQEEDIKRDRKKEKKKERKRTNLNEWIGHNGYF